MKGNILLLAALSSVVFISTDVFARKHPSSDETALAASPAASSTVSLNFDAPNASAGVAPGVSPSISPALPKQKRSAPPPPAFANSTALYQWILEAGHAVLKPSKNKAGAISYALMASGVNPLVVRRDAKGHVHQDSLDHVLSLFSYASKAPTRLDIVSGEFKKGGRTHGATVTHFKILSAQPHGAKAILFKVQPPKGILSIQAGQYHPVFLFLQKEKSNAGEMAVRGRDIYRGRRSGLHNPWRAERES